MTTLVFDGKRLVCDSQVTTENYADTSGYDKLFKVCFDDESIGWVSGVGDYSEIRCFVDSGLEPLCDEAESEILVLYESGECWYYDANGCYEITKPTALGSGAGIARGAMLAGADAIRALEIAIELDPMTGGAIQRSDK